MIEDIVILIESLLHGIVAMAIGAFIGIAVDIAENDPYE